MVATSEQHCELSILGGNSPKCKYSLSTAAPRLSISRYGNDSWLVDTAEYLLWVPTLVFTSRGCALVWICGRTSPVYRHILVMREPVYPPLTWTPLTIPETHIEAVKLHRIHEQLVLDPTETLSIETLPPPVVPHHTYLYPAPIVILIVVVTTILVFLVFAGKKKWFSRIRFKIDRNAGESVPAEVPPATGPVSVHTVVSTITSPASLIV